MLQFIRWNDTFAGASYNELERSKIDINISTMENFNWTKFTRRIAIKSQLSKIYHAWTRATEIEKWFLSNADFFNSDKNLVDKNINIEKEFSYEWHWYLYDSVEHGNITEANGRDFIQFTFEKSIVDVKLTEQGGYVIVELTQKDIPTDDESKENIRIGCASGWSFYLVNLKSVYEGGLDLRNKDISLTPMVNN